MKQKIALKFAKLAQKKEKIPSRSDLLTEGISRDKVKYYFGNYQNLYNFVLENYSSYLRQVPSVSIFNQQVHQKIVDNVKKHKTFVITTAVAGASVHKTFLYSLKNYCKINKAMLMVIPSNYALYSISGAILKDPDIKIIFKPIYLNKNIYVDPIKIDPKQIDPTTGLQILSNNNSSTVIVGSPKQRRIPVATSNSKMARIIQSTGSITKPMYIPRDGIPKRRDRLAENGHVMGAVVVEIVDDVHYHFRVVQMNKKGKFIDLFYEYGPTGPKKFVGCEAIVQGDYHVTETDPTVDKAVDEMCALGRPTYRVFHDFFSGISINHHEIKNKVVRAALASKEKIFLEKELQENAKVIKQKLNLKTAKHLVFVKSNHDEFLDRYLANGDFEDHNRIVATKLQLAAMLNHDPLKYAMEKLYNVPFDNIIWLNRDQDFRVAGIEIGAHGDLGANGKKNPGAKGMYSAYGNVVYGHCHYGEMFLGAWSVGTSTFLKLSYNRGASSWDNSQCIIYKDGTRQLINVIKGEWRLK